MNAESPFRQEQLGETLVQRVGRSDLFAECSSEVGQGGDLLHSIFEWDAEAERFRVPGAFEPDGLLGAAAAAAGVVPPSSLLPVQRRAHLVYFVHPATVLMLFPTHALSLRFLPSAPGRCTLRYELLAPAATDDASERWRASLIPGYAALLEEDLENLPWLERGLFSGRVDAHPLSALEVRVAWFRDALREDREAALLARNEHAPGLGDNGDSDGPAAERQDLAR